MAARKYADSWEALEDALEDHLETILPLIFEPPPGPLNKRVRRKMRIKNSDGNLVSTTSAVEFEELKYWQRMAIGLAPVVRKQIKTKRASPKLALDWGAFQLACGVVMAGALTGKTDEGRKRVTDAAKVIRSRNPQRLWFSRELLCLIDKNKLSRPRAETCFVEALRSTLKRAAFPKEFPRRWFEVMLKGGALKSTYLQKQLSLRQMRKITLSAGHPIPEKGFLLYPEPAGRGKPSPN